MPNLQKGGGKRVDRGREDDEDILRPVLLTSARAAEAEANLVSMKRAEHVEFCWNCGGDVVEIMHCIICDQDSSVCNCEDFTWWRINRCVYCDSVWGE